MTIYPPEIIARAVDTASIQRLSLGEIKVGEEVFQGITETIKAATLERGGIGLNILYAELEACDCDFLSFQKVLLCLTRTGLVRKNSDNTISWANQ